MKKPTSVAIRMYRHGFGDCFLLRFFQEQKSAFTILIDCGLKKNDSVPDVSLVDVVEDIRSLTNGNGDGTPHLDVLVVTHEHYDHVSGFHPSLKLFDDFEIDEIWMSWTENPKDKEAKAINAYLRMGLAALRAAVKKIKTKNKADKQTGFYGLFVDGNELSAARDDFEQSLDDLLGFYGGLSIKEVSTSGIKYNPIDDMSIETLEAFDHIKTKLGGTKSKLRFFEPGDVIDQLGEILGVRIFVLGPPRSEMLNKDAPSSGKKKEVYLGMNDPSLIGYMKGVLHHDGSDVEDGSPFCEVNFISEDMAPQDTWLNRTYFSKSENWRTIDGDWLDAAGTLALQLDGCINNSSLVLAIQLMDTEQVLLFPGDAQVGNWLSWQDLVWNDTDGNGSKTELTVSNLLAQTVFYKVAHHASHNGTLKALGLEMMTHPDLVAFIPEKQKQYKGIPHTPLVNALYEQTKGRVVFSADNKHLPSNLINSSKPTSLSQKEWQAFLKRLDVQQKYVEFRLEL